jgi:hypothetical protein
MKDELRRNPETARECFDDIGKELNITKSDQWYSISPQDIENIGGKRLLNFYGGSVMKMVTSLLPSKLYRHRVSLSKIILGRYGDSNTIRFLKCIGKTIRMQWSS